MIPSRNGEHMHVERPQKRHCLWLRWKWHRLQVWVSWQWHLWVPQSRAEWRQSFRAMVPRDRAEWISVAREYVVVWLALVIGAAVIVTEFGQLSWWQAGLMGCGWGYIVIYGLRRLGRRG